MDPIGTTAVETVNEATTQGPQTEEVWKAHIGAARKFSGSDTEYCRQKGLDLRLFRSYKKKYRAQSLPAPRVTEPPKAFVQLERKEFTSQRNQEPKPTPLPTLGSNETHLPDPRWAAEFVAALISAVSRR